jgi:hypothetical protein
MIQPCLKHGKHGEFPIKTFQFPVSYHKKSFELLPYGISTGGTGYRLFFAKRSGIPRRKAYKNIYGERGKIATLAVFHFRLVKNKCERRRQ